MTDVHITYDKQVQAAYIRLGEAVPAARTDQIDPHVLIDYGPDGKVAGVELIGVTRPVMGGEGTVGNE